MAQPSTFPHYRVGLIELFCCALFFAFGPGMAATGARPVEPADAAASEPMQQFLARETEDHTYRAFRRLEAENRGRTAWLEAWTSFSPGRFQFQISSEGGSDYIRSRVLRPFLEGERAAIERGDHARSAIATTNYRFESDGLDPSGLVRIALVPRRNEGVLVAGSLFLKPFDGELVRLEGRLVRNPSFWVKQVDIVRSYARIAGAVLPVELETRAQLRMLGPASFRMTYEYAEIDGAPVASGQLAAAGGQ